MRLFMSLLFALMLFSAFCLAQENQGTSSAQDQRANASEETHKDAKKSQQDTQATTPFSEDVAYQMLSKVRDGLVGHSQRVMLSAFDPDKMKDYVTFQDQIRAFFAQYEAFRVHFRMAQTTVEDARGIALVDFEIEEIPRNGNEPPLRKNSQIRFEFEPGKKGWRIVDFRPRGFFS